MKRLFFRKYRDLEGQGGYERNVHAVAEKHKPIILAGQKELAKKAKENSVFTNAELKGIPIPDAQKWVEAN